jgi:Putative, 10TM heavy-metal exporter
MNAGGVMALLVGLVQKTLMITSFVAVMMLVVEYVNVLTRGTLVRALQGARWRQLVLAALLGAIPGCLGAYAVVALFAHRKVSLGALVATMIATSGDETFVMLALFPGVAIVMSIGLAVVGVAAGWVTDRWIAPRLTQGDAPCCDFDVHEAHARDCFPLGRLLEAWRPPSAYRATLVVGLALLVFALATGEIGPPGWGWKRITFLIVMGIGLFITSTVPDHFLEDHLWHHVVLRHVPRVFLWTLAALGVLTVLTRFVDFNALPPGSDWVLLAGAGLFGLLPESGPHLIFATMFADGLAPISVLIASSVVQDGHGMLPLLSASKRTFIIVKMINLAVGMTLGGALLAMGL